MVLKFWFGLVCNIYCCHLDNNFKLDRVGLRRSRALVCVYVSIIYFLSKILHTHKYPFSPGPHFLTFHIHFVIVYLHLFSVTFPLSLSLSLLLSLSLSLPLPPLPHSRFFTCSRIVFSQSHGDSEAIKPGRS